MSSKSNKRERKESDKDVNDQPPSKKQKIENCTNTDKMEMDSDDYDDEQQTMTVPALENKSLIFFAATVSNAEINRFCRDVIQKNGFKVIERKEFKNDDATDTNANRYIQCIHNNLPIRRILEAVFFECDIGCSTIDVSDIVKLGIFDAFAKNNSFSVIVVQGNDRQPNQTDEFYRKLNAETKKNWTKESFHRIYVTLNFMDFYTKYNLLFLSANITKKIETNEGLSLMPTVDMVNASNTIKCCCTGVYMYSNGNAECQKVYSDYIRIYGYNLMAKQRYWRCIEMYLNSQTHFMDKIWLYLGYSVHDKIDKYTMAQYYCWHCKETCVAQSEAKMQFTVMNAIFLENQKCKNSMTKNALQKSNKNTNKKKKTKEKDTGRLCEICNVSVPSSQKNWKEHIEGKKHKKKLAKQAK